MVEVIALTAAGLALWCVLAALAAVVLGRLCGRSEQVDELPAERHVRAGAAREWHAA
jgi:hypothetical protein